MDILRRGWYINHSGVSGTSRRMGSDVTKIVAKEGESNAVIFTTCNKNYETRYPMSGFMRHDRRARFLLLAVYLLVHVTACVSTTQEPVTFSTAADLAVNEVPLCGNLGLANDEKVYILDADENQVLLTVYSDYLPGDAYYRSEGYSSYSKKIIVYNWTAGEIAAEYELRTDAFCTDGILADDGFLCVFLEPGGEDLYSAKIVHITFDLQAETIFACQTYNIAYHVPEIISLKDGAFAFTYYHAGENTFGIQAGSLAGGIAPVYTASDADEFIGTELSGNGAQFLYYVYRNGKPSLLVGDQSSVLSTLTLEDSQSMHSFCLTGEYVVAALQDQSKAALKDEVCLFDFSGELLLRQPYDVLFRMKFDKSGGIFAIDMKYNAYSILFQPGMDDAAISRRKLDVPNESAIFYPINRQSCLISSGSSQPRLLEVSAQNR